MYEIRGPQDVIEILKQIVSNEKKSRERMDVQETLLFDSSKRSKRSVRRVFEARQIIKYVRPMIENKGSEHLAVKMVWAWGERRQCTTGSKACTVVPKHVWYGFRRGSEACIVRI